ncbi:hypothetical protein A7U60_g5826 [Sanghuangporus baumii]|uniref:Uncharacterized protein n=1 Tax=Sanghuangporus baumii TaxID=108892 RepID=A0A9Q5N7M3_SANBA|nr:hypothetical protein A7U60_g5826 [Sanghuangporus baumii]
MSKQEPGDHNKKNNVPVSNRHRQEDQTRTKPAESEYPEARSGARHVHFETPKNHGDHPGGRRVRGEPRSTRRQHEDNRRRCGEFGSEPFQETGKNGDQMAKHTYKEKSKEDFQRRAAIQRLEHSNVIAEIAYDSDRLEEYEMMHEYEEERRRKYLSATRHRTASRKKGQRPSLLQRFTSLLTVQKSNERLPRKAIQLEIVQGKRKNEIQEESMVLPKNERLSSILPRAMDRGHDTLIKLWDEVEQAEGKCDLCGRLLIGSVSMMSLDSLHIAVMLRYAEANQSRKEEWAQCASQLEEILATTTSQSARTK